MAKTILISATVNGQPDLYAVAVDGAMTRLTDDVEDEVAPSWSHDGTRGVVRRAPRAAPGR